MRFRQHVVISSQALRDEFARRTRAEVPGSGPSMCGALFNWLPGRSRSFRQAPSILRPVATATTMSSWRRHWAGRATRSSPAIRLLVFDPFHAIRILAPSGFWKWESARDDR